jgi:uracil-DNA glycosylase
MGLAFSIEKDIRPLPGSLRNIFKELQSDLGILRTDGCLEDWSKQGVLLLNTVLTVEEGKPQSHAKMGWEDVTDEILSSLRKKGILFVLWGKSAQNKTKLLNGERILMAAHPSPLSAHNGFYGSKPFSSINTYLEEKGLPTITWG